MARDSSSYIAVKMKYDNDYTNNNDATSHQQKQEQQQSGLKRTSNKTKNVHFVQEEVRIELDPCPQCEENSDEEVFKLEL